MQTQIKVLDTASSVNLLPVIHSQIDPIWHLVEGYLQSGVDSMNGRMTILDAYAALKERRWQLWTATKNHEIVACATTSINNHPQITMCMVHILAGKGHQNWQRFESQIADWAKQNNCNGMEAIARKGWKRIYKDYEDSHIFLEKMF